MLELIIELIFSFLELKGIIAICSSLRLDLPQLNKCNWVRTNYQMCSPLQDEWLHELHCNFILVFALWPKLVDFVSTTTSKMKAIWVWHDNNVIANDFCNFRNWIKLKKTMPAIPIVWSQNIHNGYMCNPWLFQVCSNFIWNSYLHIIEPLRQNLQQYFLSSSAFLLVFPSSDNWAALCSAVCWFLE